MPIIIDYLSTGFPPTAPVSNGNGTLPATWDDLAWAAITIGRPDWVNVVGHGDSSLYEAIFRWSLLRMALEQTGPTARRLRRTSAAKALDPTEKGAVNYFVGMLMCKLFAEKLLDAPWLLHLDVYGRSIAQVLTGRSRPDLIGQIAGTNDWIVLESKGRISPPSIKDKQKAKEQASRVKSIGGVTPKYAIGAIAFLRNDVLQFEWEDPVPNADGSARDGFELPVLASDAWRFHYQLALAVFRAQNNSSSTSGIASMPSNLRSVDIRVEIHPDVLRPLMKSDWNMAKAVADRSRDVFSKLGFKADGLKVTAGQSWLKPYARGLLEQSGN